MTTTDQVLTERMRKKYGSVAWLQMPRGIRRVLLDREDSIPNDIPMPARNFDVAVPFVQADHARMPGPKIYVVRCADFVKIGYARDVALRIRKFMAVNPLDLELLTTFPGGRTEELELHKRFAAHRHRDEWFRIEGAVADWIKALITAPDGGTT